MAEITLFFSAFLAATILPFSSEAALVIALENEMNPITALIVASSGNILAITLNFFLGYLLYEKYHQKITNSSIGRYALYVAKTRTTLALLLSFLPIIGDPITLASGLLKINFYYFFVIVSLLRISRYFAIIYLYL